MKSVRFAVASLCVFLAACAGAPKPGETRQKDPEGVKRKLHCDAQALPFFVVERDSIRPTKLSGGGDLRHSFTYAMCPMPNDAVTPGTLVRRIKQGDQTILEDVTDPFELKPGRWTVTAVIRVPPEASAGRYTLVTEVRAGSLHYDTEHAFEVAAGKK